MDNLQTIHNLFWGMTTHPEVLTSIDALNVLPTRRVDGMKAEIAELISEKLCRLPKGEGRKILTAVNN